MSFFRMSQYQYFFFHFHMKITETFHKINFFDSFKSILILFSCIIIITKEALL